MILICNTRFPTFSISHLISSSVDFILIVRKSTFAVDEENTTIGRVFASFSFLDCSVKKSEEDWR